MILVAKPESTCHDAVRWFTIVWLDNLESQFVIKGVVVRLNWDLSSMVAKWKVINK